MFKSKVFVVIVVFISFLLVLPSQAAQPSNSGAATCTQSKPTCKDNLRIRNGLFDQEQKYTLGLKSLDSETVSIHDATGNFTATHHPQITVHNGKLHAMWSAWIWSRQLRKMVESEGSHYQHVYYSTSEDGLNWTKSVLLFKDPDGKEGPALWMAAGFLSTKDGLIAYGNLLSDTNSDKPDGMKWGDVLQFYAKTLTDGKKWSDEKLLLDNYFCNESPRPMVNGDLLMPGEDRKSQPRIKYTTDRNGMKNWTDGKIALIDQKKQPNEPSWFTRPDGTVVMIFRDDNFSKRLYVAYTKDHGRTWTKPVQTNFPDTKGKNRAGNLPDGTCYIISNPSVSFGRNPLTISLSADGSLFDRAFVLKNEAKWTCNDGRELKGTYEYPSAVIRDDYLYIIYSAYKRDIGVTRIALDKLKAQ
jgi:hypothetical protein